MKQALVTGAYGFVGRHVARKASLHGYDVTGIGHGSWSRNEWQEWGIARWHTADVTLETLMRFAGEPEVILHCAGSGSVPFSMHHPYQDHERTIGTTLSVLEFIRLCNPKTKAIIPSSASVYGKVGKLPIGIDSALQPVSPYGVHKKMAEEICQSFGRHFGVETSIVRLFSIYGNGLRKQLLWDACSKIASGDLVFSGTGLETRDWLHIGDAAELLISAIDHASTGCSVVNGGSGVALQIREIVEAVASDLGVTERPRFTGSVRAGDPSHYQADIAEALKWGWTPQSDWRQNLKSYVNWFRAGAQ